MSETPKRIETADEFYERFSTNEISEPAPRPSLLDIIRIDGRWAQIGPSQDTFSFLDDHGRAMQSMNWNEYRLVRKYNGVQVGTYRRFEPDQMSDEDFENIVWGEELKDNPHLRKLVTVFGEYERKENIT